ncbi:hypothetical protein BDP27DRAFT_896694 [Rhodocollybia butyracea]|uniref:TECPR1-like DysF domain-containing protein n=1 Tax=Rhodocollybia butyracea TaxID=206335 RepID=A0A9P5UEJ4_9AGAR|nr:hypothetical protein BDP27DRAFT_896694 [Rhodocollybia butyracea]
MGSHVRKSTRSNRILYSLLYSSNSLLPSDPPPFTIPSAISLKRENQPNVSLKQYPLPDGTWHWVSKSWMVDMRSDSGEVQHDGFEYNFWFRSNHWSATCGTFSWVRRRRWVRLMMRPGKKRRMVTEEEDAPTPTTTISSPFRATTPVPSVSTGKRDTLYLPEIWQGSVDDDWLMCREQMRVTGSDGAKLELWKRWLGLIETSDDNDVPLEYVTAVLRAKLTTILKDFFMFPESRRGFIEMLFKANVFDEVSGMDHSTTLIKALDFWSLNDRFIQSPPIRSSKSFV